MDAIYGKWEITEYIGSARANPGISSVILREQGRTNELGTIVEIGETVEFSYGSEDRILPHGAKYRAITIWDIFQEFVKYTILGWTRGPFPENIPNEAFALYENEYTDAIIEIIHAHLFHREEYGDYQIYIGNYGVNTDVKDRNKGYNVPSDRGIEYGKWWVFREKDTLDKNGKVIVESDGGAQYQFPGRYDNFELAPNIYGPRIEGIVDAERLILSLRVDESDEVKELGTSMDEDDANTVRYYLKN